MKRLLLVLAAGLAWAGCTSSDAPADHLVSSLSVSDAQLVDVRTEDEFASGHLTGAQHIDLMQPNFGERAAAALDPERPVYLYCGSGHRSGRAAAVLREQGFTTVINAGAYASLKEAGAPVTE